MIQRILLIGFMGSGKSTVGRVLAGLLGWLFVDLDTAVEEAERRRIAEIFAEAGELHFRALEFAAIQRLLGQQQLVLALGGGAPTNQDVRSLLQTTPNTAVVHLQAPFAMLYDRCRAQSLDPNAAIRPLLEDRAATEARFHQRQSIYASLAHHTIAADLCSPQELALSIAKRVFGVPGQ